ncbi:hypothetical protein ACWKWP_10285 [Agromyces soli]
MTAPDDGTRGTERLRDALRRDAAHAPGAPIDLDVVLASSASVRRRRRTTVLGGAAAAVVVLAAGGFALSLWLDGRGSVSTTAGSPVSGAPEAGEQTDASTGSGGAVAPADQAPFASDLALAPLDRLNACGSVPVSASSAAVDGLELRVDPPAALAPGGRSTVAVTLVNTGAAPFSGELRSGPALTVADDVTVWHTSGLELVGEPIELEPGASTSFEAELVAERCEAADEAGPALPPTLPPLAPGPYRLSAAVSLGGIAGEGSLGGTVLIAPPVPFVVR